jgi:hypothetical protein
MSCHQARPDLHKMPNAIVGVVADHVRTDGATGAARPRLQRLRAGLVWDGRKLTGPGFY